MSILTKFREQPITGEFTLISLSKGLTAIIDLKLYDELNLYHWRAVLSGSCFYAVRRELHYGVIKTVRMHRQVAQTIDGMECHHINGNSLDNRRGNLLNLMPNQHWDIHRGKVFPD